MKDTREKLLSTAFRTLESDGPHALKARRLAAEIGASTMAIYTHFGGMPGLIDALVREGLSRFAAHVRARPAIDDPLANLFAGGLAFGEFALANPQLYRLMFGLGDGSAPKARVTWQMEEGVDAFSVLLGSVERVIEAGEFRPQDPREAAVQVLSVTHGYLMLLIGGFVEHELETALEPMSINLMVGLGADREKAERALAEAAAARQA